MSMQNLSWLFIGVGLGVVVGEEELWIFLFGMAILIIGFVFQFIDEKERHKQFYNDLLDKEYNIKSKKRNKKIK